MAMQMSMSGTCQARVNGVLHQSFGTKGVTLERNSNVQKTKLTDGIKLVRNYKWMWRGGNKWFGDITSNLKGLSHIYPNVWGFFFCYCEELGIRPHQIYSKISVAHTIVYEWNALDDEDQVEEERGRVYMCVVEKVAAKEEVIVRHKRSFLPRHQP